MSKNKLLKAKAKIYMIVFILSVCCLDSDSVIPIIICLLTAAWFLLFTIANTTGGR